jgi:Histidine kinase-, DNA gyrase B-, and HSP90-like ATPase
MTVLQMLAQHDALQRLAVSRDPIKALAEFVWNALDADAEQVSVAFKRNALGGIEGIVIHDDGTGITQQRALSDFQNLGLSWKKEKRRSTNNRVLHGKEGQGRLKFFSIALKAHWKSYYTQTDGLSGIEIEIDSAALHKSTVLYMDTIPIDAKRGTEVTLAPLKEAFDWLPGAQARAEITTILAPYLLLYPHVSVFYDGSRLEPATTITNLHDFPIVSLTCPTRTVSDLSIKVIEWATSQGERKIHFGGESGVVLGSIAAKVAAPGFEFSAYAYSAVFDEFAVGNLLELDNLSDPDHAHIVQFVRDQLGGYFRQRQAEKAASLIDELKNAGVYPYEGDPKSEVEKVEREVVDIAIHAVSSYSREFKGADNAMKRMTLRLLRQAVRHNPESIHEILQHVFNLPKNKQDDFSNLLRRTNLGNIISASTLISDRVVALEVLKGVVFNQIHAAKVKERGELDVLVQSNTWLFGEGFHITLPEAGLTKVMARVSEELHQSSTRVKIRKPDGRVGRVDAFLGRSVPNQKPSHREFFLVELKRPNLKLTRKELNQLEDYVNALRGQNDFRSTSTYWHFFLVASEYDETVETRVTQVNRPKGLFLDGENYQVWVKTWGEIVREAESRLQFITEKLQIEVSDDEIEQRIKDLRSAILKPTIRDNDPVENSVDETKVDPI